MNHPRLSHLFLFTLCWVLSSCGSTDTVLVVEQQPVTEVASREDEDSEVAERFVEISIGLIDPVTNLDPLFAGNLSTKRVIPLLFDGLVTLDRNGEAVWNLASGIEISDDGLLYTIQIDRENFYRNSTVFPSGIGRRVHAADVKYAFERAAANSVPDAAAELLMGIRGFENYFLEQRQLFDAEQRVLDGVHGIRVVDAETVVMELKEPDEEFIRKLASPYLVIYPQEGVENNRSGFAVNPVGSGSYSLSSMDEGVLVLNRTENGNGNDSDLRPAVNRITLRYFENEADLMQSFTDGETDWIPEAGPLMKSQMIGSEGSLIPAYSADYGMHTDESYRLLSVWLHEQTGANTDWLIGRLSLATTEDFTIPGEIRLSLENFEMNENAVPDSTYYITLTDDYFARVLFNQMHSIIVQPEASLVYFDIRVPTSFTSLYAGSTDSLHRLWVSGENDAWLELESDIVSIYHSGMQNMEPSAVPWLLFLQDLTVQEPN